MRRSYLLLLFFLSGISGLIYQITWVRQASLTFGVSVYAFSAVLTAYMAGLALGSYLLGKRIDQARRPLQTYAFVEVGIAVLAILTYFVLIALNNLYADLTRSLQPGLGVLTFLRLVFSVVAIAPTTILIGATLPVMSRLYVARSGQVGSDVGTLYTINTAGAVLGCILTALFLIRVFGVREAVFIGAALNLIVAVFAYWKSLDKQPVTPLAEPAAAPASRRRARASGFRPAAEDITPKARYYIAIGYTVSGFVALGYEVVWARILTIHTTHAVYSFALILTVFLAGLAIGGAIGTRWLRRHRASLLQFGILQLAIGLLALIALFVFSKLPSLPIEVVFGGINITLQVLYELFLAFITFFPPTLLIGVLFPVVGSLFTKEQVSDIGLRIGTVSAFNTVGSILGALGTGFLLIPLLGLRNTALTLSAINLIIGTGAIWLIKNPQPRIQWLPPASIAAAAIAVLILPPGLYLGFREGPSEHLVYYREGVETTVAVFDVVEQDFKVSFVNGRNEVPTDSISMAAFRLLGHLPALLKPDAENALVLSFGNGIATGSLDTHNIPSIEAVDLSEEMVEAAEIYWEENYNVLQSAHLNINIEDARNFLLQTDNQYDIITTDATHPANASSWALFTQEFYQLIAGRLSQDGVFVQWLPFHSLLEDDYRAIIRTALTIFPHVSLWYTGGTHTFLVITPETIDDERMAEILQVAGEDPFVLDDLGPPPIIRDFLLMDEDMLADYANSGRLVTDNNAFFFPTNVETQIILSKMQAIARQ